MKPILINWTVTSKFNGLSVCNGEQKIESLDKRTFKDHVRSTKTFLENQWPKCAYEVWIGWNHG